MTNNNDEHRPAWRDAWRLDDPDWVKARQRDWKTIRNSAFIKELLMPNKDELKKIKNFFLIGSAFDPEPPEENWRWECYHPDSSPMPVPDAMLLELWLTADDSESNWKHIDNKYTKGDHRSARDRFRSTLHRLYPEHGSVFDGREARIYTMLGPTRCRREDYPDVTEDQFRRISKSVNSTLGAPIKAHLTTDQPNPDSITPILAREWCDSVIKAYECSIDEAEELQNPAFLDVYMEGIQNTVSTSRQIVQSPEHYHSTQIELSHNIITFLSEMEMPPPLQDVLGKYLN